MKLNPAAYFLVLPVVFSNAIFCKGAQAILLSLVAMSLAETLRQYLAATFVRELEIPRQLFFFGVIYKDNLGFFSSAKPPPRLSRGRKMLMLAGVYILIMALRFSPAFASLEMLPMALFSLILTLWVNCTTYPALSRVLTLQILCTSLYFVSQADASVVGFLIWLTLALWTQSQLHRWQQESSVTLTLSGSGISKVLGTVLILFMCFSAADFLVPRYDEEGYTAPAGSNEASYSYTSKKKSPALPKKFLQKMAKLKLQAGAVDLKKLLGSKSEIPNLNLPPGKGSSSAPAFQYGENQNGLEEIKQSLAQDKDVDPSQLEKLRELSKKINTPPDTNGAAAAMDPEDKMIQDRIDKLKSLQKEEPEIPTAAGKKVEKSNEDDAAAYIRSRKELATEVDKLISKDQVNTLAKEELNLQALFEKILEGLKRFSFLIALTAVLAYLLTRKRIGAANEPGKEKAFDLPKEVRMRLRTLYKILLSGKFTTQEEVIKSFYIVELAFKEIEYGRDEALPPHNFLENLARDLPFIYNSAKIPIELFNRVFYGNKNPDQTQISELRACMKSLMKKLQVI